MTALSKAAVSQKAQKWQRRCAEYARQHGFPHAEHVGHGPFSKQGTGDLLNVGDRIIECTISPLGLLWEKLDQAEGDAARQEFAQFFVWKIAQGKPIGQSYMMTRAGVLWPLLARLDRLEWQEAEMAGSAQDARDAGYRDGYRDGLAARDGANR